MFLVVDLETVADLSRWTPPADKPDAFAPTWAQRVIVAGYVLLSKSYEFIEIDSFGLGMSGTPDEQERKALFGLSKLIAEHRATVVTWNGRRFDVEVIVQRSFCHGVPLPWYYKNREARKRYSEIGHLDLCDQLSDHGAGTYFSLDVAAKMLGLPGKVGVDGSQVGAMFAAGELDAIERYCLADVAQTALALIQYRRIQGALLMAEADARSAALLARFRKEPRLAELFTPSTEKAA
jgi:predicted PolB exonuclease-like 3'-5' exonuclease